MEAARQTDDETERKLIQWELLQQKSVTAPFDSYTEFLSSVSNWPLRATIQLRAEEIFPDTLPDSEVTAWFADRKPITTRGLLRYGRAMMATGRGSEAVTVVRDYFINRDFSTDGAAQIMAAFPGMLNAKDIAARVDKLIWEEKLTEARSLLAYLPESERAVPATRLALLQQEPRAEKLLDALSENQRNDPNVAFARAHWRRELGFDNSAAVILARITAPSSREEEVATERAILARRFFGEGDFGAAYAVLAGQPAVQGQNATQNIWHAGWLALRFKQDTVAAARHFQQFYDLVQMPVSKTRGAYWLGRTAAAAGQSDVARQWYQQAATDGTTFYGQLATQELRQSLRLPARETATQDYWQQWAIQTTRAHFSAVFWAMQRNGHSLWRWRIGLRARTSRSGRFSAARQRSVQALWVLRLAIPFCQKLCRRNLIAVRIVP
jgi:soluble lytic murein transglycosylase